MYFFGKRKEDRPESFNLRVMHTFNKIAIVVFLLGLLYKVIEYLFF